MTSASRFLESPIEYLRGVGPIKGELLRKQADIGTFEDLLFDFPFRYIDRTQFHTIKEAREGDTVQLVGQFVELKESGFRNRKRLTGTFQDATGSVDVIWFRSVKWIKQSIKLFVPYTLYGRVTRYRSRLNIAHPELEVHSKTAKGQRAALDPVYHSTEKLTAKGLDSRGRRKLIENLLEKLHPSHLPENLPVYLVSKMKFHNRYQTLREIHMPTSMEAKDQAVRRMKFEELFFSQLQLIAAKQQRQQSLRGVVFETVGEHVHAFYEKNLPFELTGAQKRVIREIRRDLKSGVQMNRLLQGDVGSGKTIVAVMTMLIAIDNGYQCCLLAPTEILAQQHYQSIRKYLDNLGLRVAFLSGSIKGEKRKAVLYGLRRGNIHIIVGTHAILEDPVRFSKLGVAITDEQHRFGVEQRARLWRKGGETPPHILVMTATPIPRTLAMTIYGDLDVSVIDELPPGRKPVKTIHRTEGHRPQVINFLKQEIAQGRQVFIIYPLIEESEKLDLENLQQGYEKLLQWFPPPEYQISVVHGRMKSEAKEFEMKRFVQKKTHIMVATTVIEVGVDVPNASVMVIENAERFGLSQLHQLRGRVGRGAEQSYCILMTGNKTTTDARERIKTMVRTNNGFEIAEADLRLRGPGDVAGTRQSGITQFQLVNLGEDTRILQTARAIAHRILEDDPQLAKSINKPLRDYLLSSPALLKQWHRVG
ncbi:MAG: ATP-dependent DNA helicase RecG [Saprospiraceae bacterium]|nr:ATP-dependent DNA helicase RecG [Saprospiraceae bacterium]